MKILMPSKTWTRGRGISQMPKEKLLVCFSRANSRGDVSNGEIFCTGNRRGRERKRDGDERDKTEKEKGAAARCQRFLRNFRY